MNNDQKETLEQLITYVTNDQSILGLILCGSLAKGTETDRSDVDLFVVVTDERFEQARAAKHYFWGTGSRADQFKVEVDGKIIPKDFLRMVWLYGNESIKSTLLDAKIIYSRDPEIEAVLSEKSSIKIDQTENLRKFYALMKSSRYSADDQRENLLFVNQCIYNTVFYACRLVLAHNHQLYPCAKNLRKALDQCQELPNDFIRLMDEVMRSYAYDKMVEFYDHVDEYFKACRFDDRLRKGYVLENEWFWYFDTFPYAEI